MKRGNKDEDVAEESKGGRGEIVANNIDHSPKMILERKLYSFVTWEWTKLARKKPRYTCDNFV